MKNKKKVFKVQIIALAALALSVFIMPIFSEIWMKSNNNWIIVVNGLLFWTSFLTLTVVSIYFCRMRRRSSFTKNKMPGYNRLGLIHFCQNSEAKIADIMMCISVICFLGMMIGDVGVPKITFFVLGILIFSFGMHCLFNGAGYLYAQYDAEAE